MDQGQVILSVVSVIGLPVVAWTVNRLVNLGERVSKLEARKCLGCEDDKH
jgi:hypothetical protein